MKIGAVSFLNAYPLYWGLESFNEIDIVREIPSKLADLLLDNKLDTAIISSIEYFKNRDKLSYYPDLCIAAKGKVESIRFFTKPLVRFQDFESWIRQNSSIKIYFDRATRSSLAMMQILCSHYGNPENIIYEMIEPPFEDILNNLDHNEGLLLIGDPALKYSYLPSIDLGELYFHTFQKSFVYAIWVYRKNSSTDIRTRLVDAYEYGQKNFRSMLDDAVRTFGFPRVFTKNYLSNIIQYRLSEDLKNDMLFFFDKYATLQKNGIISN